MANTPSFVQHALDLVSLVGPVRARAMFGGHGLYLGDAMFGLLDDDDLFLKTDAETVARFDEARCQAWVYVGPQGPQRTSYYRPPDDAHEDPEAMLPWARLAVEAALRAAAAKAARKKPRAPAPRKKAPARPATREKAPSRRAAPGRAARRRSARRR